MTTNGLGRVVRLDLSGQWNAERREWEVHGLRGQIPAYLGGLANLTVLNLAGNELTGPVPPQLGDLADLEQLDISANDLTGPIPPQLGSLANLSDLRIHSNNFTGPIPPELGNLANLVVLKRSQNNLTGPIPSELGSLANLRLLTLSNNDLTGPIPSSFLELKLVVLRLRTNSLYIPGATAFAAWLQGIPNKDGRRLPTCSSTGARGGIGVDPKGNLVRHFIGEGDGHGGFRSDFAKGLRFAVMWDGQVDRLRSGGCRIRPLSAQTASRTHNPLEGDRRRRPMLGDISSLPGNGAGALRDLGCLHVET